MGKNYPSFRPSYSHEELVEPFLLTPGELDLILRCRGDANRCGMALLLKTLPHLGYVPDCLDDIPPEVREFIAGQIGLLWDYSESYPQFVVTVPVVGGGDALDAHVRALSEYVKNQQWAQLPAMLPAAGKSR